MLFSTFVFSQQVDYRSIKPPEGKSLIYIVRPSIYGIAMKFDVFCNGKSMGTTKGKQFLFIILEPGEQIIMNKAENKDAITLKTEPNKTYFIKQKIKTGALSARSKLILLNPNEGREALMKCKLSKKNVYIYNN